MRAVNSRRNVVCQAGGQTESLKNRKESVGSCKLVGSKTATTSNPGIHPPRHVTTRGIVFECKVSSLDSYRCLASVVTGKGGLPVVLLGMWSTACVASIVSLLPRLSKTSAFPPRLARPPHFFSAAIPDAQACCKKQKHTQYEKTHHFFLKNTAPAVARRGTLATPPPPSAYTAAAD